MPEINSVDDIRNISWLKNNKYKNDGKRLKMPSVRDRKHWTLIKIWSMLNSWDWVLLSKLCTQYLQPQKQFDCETDYEDLISILKNKTNDITKLPYLLRLMKSVYPVIRSMPISNDKYMDERQLVSEFFRVIFSQQWFTKLHSDWNNVKPNIK